MKQEIIKKIGDVLKELGVENPRVTFEPSAHFHLGDYSSSVAMAYAKELKKSPMDLANEIKDKLGAVSGVRDIEVVLPGFINFFFDKTYFLESIKNPFEKGNAFSGQKTIIEYTNCNVLKPMHIGHLMGNVIGESLSRVIESCGAEVKRNNYQGDSGLHIAKAVWGIMKLGGVIDGSTSEKSEYIGRAYALGANTYEDDKNVESEIKELNKQIFEKSDDKLNSIYEWGRQVSLDHFEDLYKKLGTKFDYYFFESEVADDAIKIIKEFIGKRVFEDSDGAIVFKGENYDKKLHTRVFINSQGLPTYEAKDIAHALRKYQEYKFDKSIIVTANEQNEYFKVVLRALQEINPEISQKTTHVSHGLLKLPEGKMSSRKGNTITGEVLIRDVENLVLEKIKDREFGDEEKKVIAEIVAVGAIKYSVLRQAIGGDIIFDFDKSISFEGDSGPYLQYSTVRANSILKKAEGVVSPSFDLPENWQTTNLERMLERFGNVVERAGKEYAPNHIVTCLTELAGEFNSFYAGNKIIDDGDASSGYKLALTRSFAETMTKGMNLLGIRVPDRM